MQDSRSGGAARGRAGGARPGRAGWLLALGASLACGSGQPPDAAGTAAAGALPPSAVAVTQNRPPVLQRVALSPSRPSAGDHVSAQATATDPDGDTLRFEYEWHVGDERQPGAGRVLAIPPGSKGARIEVRMIAYDGESQSQPVRASARVSNQQPRITSLVVEPAAEITVEDRLTASARAEDPDGDAVELRYTWLVNGRPAGHAGNELDARHFKRGDRIEIEAVASDGEDESEALRSPPISVVNSPPRIISSPAGLDERGSFRYTARAEDPDGDRRLRYRLLEGPAGMTLDWLSGELVWRPAEDQIGKHVVAIEVDDLAGGKATQRFEIEAGAETPPAAPAS